MSNLVCKYCKNSFKNDSCVKRHQKTTQYCLDIQGIDSKKHECKAVKCPKVYISLDNLKKHEKKCKFIQTETWEDREKELKCRLKKYKKKYNNEKEKNIKLIEDKQKLRKTLKNKKNYIYSILKKQYDSNYE